MANTDMVFAVTFLPLRFQCRASFADAGTASLITLPVVTIRLQLRALVEKIVAGLDEH